MKQSKRNEFVNYINAVSFAIDDVKLYLDTHPCDRTALEYYDYYKNLRKIAIDQYTMEFGPMTADNVDVTCGSWTWVQTPWPWEGGC